MGVSVGTGDKRSVDINLNVVPFVDLMSVLVAFLLVTAVWTQFAQINIKPKGLGRESTQLQEENKVYGSILVSENEIWIGTTDDVPIRIGKKTDQHDWVGLRKVLDSLHEGALAGRQDIEIAADDRVPYQEVINAMDTAVAAKFRDIGFIDPQSLSVRFKE